jgi:transposase
MGYQLNFLVTISASSLIPLKETDSFHVVGHDACGVMVLRQKWSRGQMEARLANIPPCLIGLEACVGAHHLSRKLASLWRSR